MEYKEWFFIATHSLLYAVAARNTLQLLGQYRNTSNLLLWIFIQLAFPYFGVPLYFLLGNNRIPKLIRKKRRTSKDYGDTSSIKNTGKENQNDHLSSRFNDICAQFSPTKANIKILVDGGDTFNAIFEEIEQAKNYILVQYYIIRSDKLGKKLKELLIKKSEQGVKVYFLIDDFGSFDLGRSYLDQLKKGGVSVAIFLPVGGIKTWFQLNFRNHRKTVIVDGESAFTGGINIGEEYRVKGTEDNWRDTHFRLSGSIVANLEDVFYDDWAFATNCSTKMKPLTSFNNCQTNISSKLEDGQYDVQLIPTGPTDTDQIALYFFMSIIQSAQNSLWIATPYFIPHETLMRELELAMLRGVKIRLLLPSVKTKTISQWAGLFHAERLVIRGADVYLYKNGFMHQKVITVDEGMTIIGSANFDNRSLFLNFDTSIICYDSRFTKLTKNILETDFDNSVLLRDLEGSPLSKFRRSAARLLSPVL
jgi:cardiolipin synthase A/B